MSNWVALFGKDLRMTRTRDVAVLGGLVVVLLLLVYLAYRYHSGVASGLAVFILLMHVFYLPIHAFLGLAREWRKHSPLWLHFPQSGWVLLSSKLAAALLMMVISVAVTAAFGAWIVHIEMVGHHGFQAGGFNPFLYPGFLLQIGLYALVGLFSASIYMGAWVAIISVAMQAVRNQLHRARWLLGLALFVLATWGVGDFASSHLFHSLFNWGRFDIVLRMPDMLHIGHVASIYAGNLVFDVALVCILLWVSVALLDKRVEVVSNE